MAFERLKNLGQRWGESLRDDKGLFQGGQSGQLGGRFQDFIGGLNDPYKGQQDLSGGEGGYGTDLSRQMGLQDVIPGQGTQTSQNVFAAEDPRLNQGFAGARGQALNIDVSNPNEVREMQQRLIQQGLLSDEVDPATGEYVQADAIFGPNTEAAMRQMQGMMPTNDPTGQEGLMKYTEFFNPQSAGGGATVTAGDNGAGDSAGDSAGDGSAVGPGLNAIRSVFKNYRSNLPQWVQDLGQPQQAVEAQLYQQFMNMSESQQQQMAAQFPNIYGKYYHNK